MDVTTNDSRALKKLELLIGIKVIIFICILLMVFNLSPNNLPLFHFLAETISIITGYAILVVVRNTLQVSNNSYFIFLGLIYAFVGTLDFAHALIQDGINLFPSYPKYISIQLFVAARYMESISLIISNKYFHKKVSFFNVFHTYMVITILIILLIFKIDFLSNITENGIYIYKTINETIPTLLLCISAAMLYRLGKKDEENRENIKLIMLSIFIKIMSQGISTFIATNGFYIFISYMLRIISFYLLYSAVIKSSLREPCKELFDKLKRKAEKLGEMNKELFIKNNELEAAKTELQNHLNKYKMFGDFLPDPIVIRKGEKIEYVNEAIVQLLGYGRKEEIMKDDSLNFVHEDYKKIVKSRMMSKGVKLPVIEEKYIKKNGETVDVEVSSISIDISNEKYTISIARDITERKKLEEVNLKLKERVEQDKIKTEFFSNISHELRTPINVIYSALQLEDMYLDTNNLENIKKYNKSIRQNCLRLLRLTNNLIDITKIDAGYFKPFLGWYNIVHVVESAVQSVVPYAENKDIGIVFDTEAEEQIVFCDPTLVERIVLNLLSNSIKYTNKQGLIYVNIYYSKEGYITISVKDDGVGIPKEDQNDIFERFTLVDKTFARKCEGSGIGLSLVKSFVEMQKGEISLISEEGKGTEIIIDFPICNTEKEVAATLDDNYTNENIIAKVNVEFSDIYF